MNHAYLAAEILRASNGRRDKPADQADPNKPGGVLATGLCGICDAPVPPSNANLFYCSHYCRSLAFRWYHQDEEGSTAP